MELLVNHLTPYLHHSLELQYIVRDKIEKTGILKKISHNEDETHPTKISIDYLDSEHIWMFKPLLHRLSDFDREYFEEMKEDFGAYWCDAYDDFFDIWFDDAMNIHKLIQQAPFCIFDYFCKKHYDVFGLINYNLASVKGVGF